MFPIVGYKLKTTINQPGTQEKEETQKTVEL
jgi:hypothetical protein